MSMKIYFKTHIKLNIYEDMEYLARTLIKDTLNNVWSDTYFYELDINDYIPYVTDLWLEQYILSDITKKAIDKINQANPPKDLDIYLDFNLYTRDDFMKIDESEIDKIPLFRVTLPTGDLWDSYVYNPEKNVFESMEIIEPEYINEMKLSMTETEKIAFDELIIQSYSFHNRLLEIVSKRIFLYTAQPPERVTEWNKKGIITKGTYFTDKMSRAEYYYEEGDIIVDYRLPKDKMVMTSDFGGAKEYVTIEDIQLK